MGIRDACKAVIIDNGRALLNKNINTMGDMCYGLPNGAHYYDLPGGGQNQYETLEEAVMRECLEETGHTIKVIKLCAVFEEISNHKLFRAEYEPYAHKVHFVFMCRPVNVPVKHITEPDLDMSGSEWVLLNDIKNIPLYPQILKNNFDRIIYAEHMLYLGLERVS